MRRVSALVNLAAIERNCARLCSELSQAALCAVVKADGYGHGAVPSARAALAGGASWLAVVDSQEALELRAAELGEVPILVMGALTPVELDEALAAGADVVIWSERQLRAVAAAGGGRVHVKLDSGMGRLGTRDAELASGLAAAARAAAGVELAGVMTHFATADELDDSGFFAEQLRVFDAWVAELRREQPGLLVHAGNSAATLRDPAAHFDMVRCGVAIYGLDPFGRDPQARGLEPALELRSYLAEVKGCVTGQSVGYGRRFIAEQDTFIGLVPLGYGDGFRRGLTNNADVLLAGRRHRLVGTVSMDSITVELGPEGEGLRGELATLIGVQGGERITAEELAGRLETINYEITCGLTRRVPRLYHRDGAPLDSAGAPAAASAGSG